MNEHQNTTTTLTFTSVSNSSKIMNIIFMFINIIKPIFCYNNKNYKVLKIINNQLYLYMYINDSVSVLNV